MFLKKGDKILFDGDSITDALRDRSDIYSLAGYSQFIAETLEAFHSELKITCYNRGVGGDTSAQLFARLAAELEEIRPTVFSLLIGVNDTWRKFDSGQQIPCRTYEHNVSQILELVSKYTDRIIVLQPFLLDVDKKKRAFRYDLDPKIRALERVARKYRVTFVPLDGVFAELSCKEEPAQYSYDGVHPTEQGHRIIAAEWLRRIQFEV